MALDQKLKVSCIQMDMPLGDPEKSYALADELIREAMKESPDVLVLPETWNVGFYPHMDLEAQSDHNLEIVKARIGGLAKELHVNIVAGSVSNVRDGLIYNTATVFDREGNLVAEYDKTHLFSPMKEDKRFTKGSRLCRFQLDGIDCAIIICYDIRFPELIRSLTV